MTAPQEICGICSDPIHLTAEGGWEHGEGWDEAMDFIDANSAWSERHPATHFTPEEWAIKEGDKVLYAAATAEWMQAHPYGSDPHHAEMMERVAKWAAEHPHL